MHCSDVMDEVRRRIEAAAPGRQVNFGFTTRGVGIIGFPFLEGIDLYEDDCDVEGETVVRVDFLPGCVSAKVTTADDLRFLDAVVDAFLHFHSEQP